MFKGIIERLLGPRPSDDAVNEADSAIAQLSSEADAKRRILEILESEMATAGRVLSSATEKVTEADATFDAARAAYADDPSSGNAKALRSAKDALELAQIVEGKRQTDLAAARTNVEGARASLEESRRAHENAVRNREIADLQVVASAERFREQTLPMFERLVAARAEMTAAAKDIDSAFRKSRDASARLAALGVVHTSIDSRHLLLGLGVVRVNSDPSCASYLLEDGGHFDMLSCVPEPQLSDVVHCPAIDGILFGRSCRPGSPNRAEEFLEMARAPDRRSAMVVSQEMSRVHAEHLAVQEQKRQAADDQEQEELRRRFVAGDPTVIKHTMGNAGSREVFRFRVKTRGGVGQEASHESPAGS